MGENIKTIPAVALRDITIFPNMIVHFDVNRSKSMQAVEKAMLMDQNIFLITQQNPQSEEPDINDLYPVGTIAQIKQVIKLPGDILRVLVEGLSKAKLLELEEDNTYLSAVVADVITDEEVIDEETQEAMFRILMELIVSYSALNPKTGKILKIHINDQESLSYIIEQLIINLPFPYQEKQKLLETTNLREQYELISDFLYKEVDILKIKADLQEKMKESVEKNQKEYLLREQLKLIRKELGDDSESEIDRFMEKVSNLKADKDTKEKIMQEIKRYESITANSSESSVSRLYIETLLDMPWNKVSKDNKDLNNAEKILEADHYGLKKVKERILEFLAVKNLTKKGESPILCLVGPPGTGKTSIAKSVARALNKQYIRISLGGVRDEAEIRGHRRTYIGAMPGRIAVGLKSAGVSNPLMLLDEIDKISSDYKGDTKSALLEVLDGEQNNKFHDHYIELPIDLSQVTFIATANSIQTIPKPLLDRMEIIEINSYTDNEKLHIANEHLMKKQLEKHGLTDSQLTISQHAMEKIIWNYTREAGVRNLERKIGDICRKSARMILQDKKASIRVTDSNLYKFLGKEQFQFDLANEIDDIGIARGLAWTSVGGDTLQIEVNIMPGKGEFKLTGQLGDVMKESAQTGISYIRSISKEHQIAENYFKQHDFHIHIPEGAVPKDGPSAGITMATALYSAIVKQAIRREVAMTGEITLRGRVLPIGGLKEKILAAKKAKIKTVLIPDKNRPDIDEIDADIIKGIRIVYVSTMQEVFDNALVKE